MKQIERAPSALDIFEIFFGHWKQILLMSVLTVVTVLALSSLRRPVYESTAEILIKPGKETIQQNPVSASVPISSYMAQWEQAVKSETEILRNQYLVEKIVDELGPDFDVAPPSPALKNLWGRIKATVKGTLKYLVRGALNFLYRIKFLESLPPREAAIKRILGGLQVNLIEDSSVLQVIFHSSYAPAAPRVLDLLLQYYIEHHRNVYRTPGTLDFFETQGILYEQQLKDAETQLEVFKKTYSISNLATQIHMLLNTCEILKLKKADFELELTKNLGKYTDESPAVQNLRKLVQETGNKYEEEQAKLNRLNAVFLENQRLERNVDVAKDAYVLYHTKGEEQRILDAMDISKLSNISIIQPASTPLQPKRIVPFFPDRTFFFFVAVFLGIIFGLSLAVLSDSLDPTIRNSRDVEDYFDVPVWSSIPEDRSFRRISG